MFGLLFVGFFLVNFLLFHVVKDKADDGEYGSAYEDGPGPVVGVCSCPSEDSDVIDDDRRYDEADEGGDEGKFTVVGEMVFDGIEDEGDEVGIFC